MITDVSRNKDVVNYSILCKPNGHSCFQAAICESGLKRYEFSFNYAYPSLPYFSISRIRVVRSLLLAKRVSNSQQLFRWLVFLPRLDVAGLLLEFKAAGWRVDGGELDVWC